MPGKRSSLNRLFKKVFAGTASDEERSLFWRWIWSVDVRVQDQSGQKEEFQRVEERIWARIQSATRPVAPVVRPHIWKPLLAAAVLTGLLVAGWAFVMHKGGEVAVSTGTMISNEGTMIRRLALPDGTEAILDIHSSLHYDSTYNTRERRVYLTGEGYFVVHRDDMRPFIIQTGEVETMALGTSINIESRQTEGQIRVALTEGRIAVSLTGKPSQKELLSPGQILFYDKGTQHFNTSHYTTDVTAWTRGGLVFNNMPLTEALDRLSDRYQLQLQYNRGRLAGRTITSTFGNVGWKGILSDICLLHDLSYHIKNNKIIIE